MRPKTISPCQVSECSKPYLARGFCGTHYAQFRKGQLPDYQPKEPEYAFQNKGQKCSYDGCPKPAVTFKLCSGHYQQHQRGIQLHPLLVSPAERGCREDDCDKPHEAHGYCNTHYTYAVGRAEIATKGHRSRRRVINSTGYAMVFLPRHPRAQKSGYVLEHIAVMGAVLDRDLLPDENVHHRNGNKTDNRPENLELWLVHQPKGQRVSDAVAWAKEILARYEPEVLA